MVTAKNKNLFLREKVEESVVLDPRLLRTNGKQTHVFHMAITAPELAVVPSILHLKGQAATVLCLVKLLSDCITVAMEVRSAVTLLDNHDLKAKKVLIKDRADLVLSADTEMADVLPDKEGRYDLRPTALALFYASVPQDFSTSALSKVEGEGYRVLSEAEYAKEQKRRDSDNPFAKLKTRMGK